MAQCTKQSGSTVCMIVGMLLRPYSYDKGWKYCSRCERVFDTTERFCPCCATLLRTKPRGREGKDDLNKRNNNNPYLH